MAKTQTVETTEPTPLNPNKIPIRLAFLHQSIIVPGVIGNEKTLSAAKIPGIKMWWTPQGLVLERKATRAIVPLANVVVGVIDE